MTVQVITPASGAVTLSFAWGSGTAIYTAGEFVSVPPGSTLEAATGRDRGVKPVGGDPGQRHSGHAHCGDEGQPVSLVAELRMPQWCPQAGESRGWSPAFTSRMLTRRAWRSR